VPIHQAHAVVAKFIRLIQSESTIVATHPQLEEKLVITT